MPTALIVEDEPLLRAALREHLAALWPDLDVSGEAGDGLAAARTLAERTPDVVFLDIQMPGLNGLELARLVSGRCHVVFVTAFQEHAVAAFDEGAVDFVVKPIDRDRLAVTMARLRERLNKEPPDLHELLRRLAAERASEPIRWIQASAGNNIRIVPVAEVSYFQADAKYTKVVCDRGEMHVRRTIKELAGRLDQEVFWQVHRGTIVNATRIDAVVRSGEQLVIKMTGRSERLPVSAPFQYRFRHG